MQLCKSLIGREERIEPQLFKDALQEHMGEEPGMPKAVRAALLYGELVGLSRRGFVAIGQKKWDERLAGLEGLFEPVHIIGEAVIKAGKGADVEHNGLGRGLDPFIVCDPVVTDQSEIRDTIILKRFNIHSASLHI